MMAKGLAVTEEKKYWLLVMNIMETKKSGNKRSFC